MKTQRSRSTGSCPLPRRFDSKVKFLASTVLAQLQTPVSESLVKSLSCGDYEAVVTASVDPRTYDNVEAFRRDYLAVSLLSKFPNFELGIDLAQASAKSFVENEVRCAAAASQLKESLRSGSLISTRTLYSVFHTAREKIARLLGPFSWDLAEPFFAFGPGATFSRPHREGDAYYKFRAKPCSTYGCSVLAYTALSRIPAWFTHVCQLAGETPETIERFPMAERPSKILKLVPGNRVTFVPKSATKMRTIAIEPTMNGFIQHGIGELIVRRLRRVGVDLHDQRLNQQLAREGSIDGSLATLDLSAASDSVSLELCKQLLPSDWFDAVCITRSEVGTLPDGTVIKYSKVSSMGNGYTFALESLIFWALCAAVTSSLSLSDRRLAVYGDDLIIPTDAVHPVVWVLEACGFLLNRSKSFSTGPFRESCGKHYFRGDDVTPFYVREDIDTNSRLIWFSNQIRRWSRLSWGLDPLLKDAYEKSVRLLPDNLRRPSIPDGYGDYGLIGDLDEVCPRWTMPSRRGAFAEGWRFSSWLPVFVTREFSDTPFLLRQLSREGSTRLSLFDEVRIARTGGWQAKSVKLMDDPSRVFRWHTPSWRRVTGTTTDWPSYGPWL